LAKKREMESGGKSKVIAVDFFNKQAYSVTDAREHNEIGKKISEARYNAGLSLTGFREELNQYGVSVQNAGINKWEMGKSVPSAYQLIAITRALNIRQGMAYFDPEIRPALNEAGMKKLDEYKSDLIATGRYVPRTNKITCRYIEMPVSTLRVSAGTGSFLDEENFENVSFPESAVPDGAEFGIRVSGDSMEPVYHDGQIVWVQKCSEVYPGEVGIFIYDGDGYIKEYDEREPDEDDLEYFTNSYGEVRMQAYLISYNQKYKPIRVSPHNELSIVGRVLN